MSTDDLDPSALDPGIRRTILWLRARGFNTTDSGDGVSKDRGAAVFHVEGADPDLGLLSAGAANGAARDLLGRLMENFDEHAQVTLGRIEVALVGEPVEVLDIPHVFIATTAARMVEDADKLKADLLAAGIMLDAGDLDATYDPITRRATLSLFNITDERLAAALAG